jgi:putative spermidine/putrescine transport system permease protein
MTRILDDILYTLLLMVVGLLVVFLLVPLVITITMAFDARDYLGSFPPSGLSLQWFKHFFGDDFYMKGLKTSINVAAVSTVLSTIIGLTAATALAEGRFGYKQALQALFLSPLVVPSVVIGFALLLFFSKIGLYSGFLPLLGGHIIITLPYTIRVSLAGLIGIPRSVKEAALVLGANEWRAFFTVSLPLARTSIFAAAVFAFVFSMDDVAVSLFLSSVNTYTLPVAMVGMMRSNFDLSIAAAAVFMMVVMTTLMLCVDRLSGINKILGSD